MTRLTWPTLIVAPALAVVAVGCSTLPGETDLEAAVPVAGVTAAVAQTPVIAETIDPITAAAPAAEPATERALAAESVEAPASADIDPMVTAHVAAVAQEWDAQWGPLPGHAAIADATLKVCTTLANDAERGVTETSWTLQQLALAAGMIASTQTGSELAVGSAVLHVATHGTYGAQTCPEFGAAVDEATA